MSNPVPNSIYRTSLEEIEAQQKERLQETRSKTQQQYSEGPREFKLHETKNTRDLLIKEAAERRDAELQFSMQFYKPVPDFARNPVEIRLNTAAILREEAQLRQQQAKEAEVIRAYETELRDASQFYAWRQTMTQQDELQRLQQVLE